jgi:hypothetical protein
VLSQWTGAAPLLNRERLKDMRGPHWLCSSGRAFAETGWRAKVPVAEGFARTVEWGVQSGIIRRRK